MGKICAFFGHRDAPDSLKPLIEEKVRELIIHHDVDTFWVGAHGKFDKMSAHIVKKCQEDFPHIQIVFIISYVNQLNQDNGICFDSFDYPIAVDCAPRRFAISARNRYVAQHTDFVIAFVQQEFGGAYEALKIAQSNHKSVMWL